MDDDDYWNTSETKLSALSFDDDVLSPQEILAIGQKPYSSKEEDIFSFANLNNVKTASLHITSLVSPKVLDLILLAQSGKDAVKEVKEQVPSVASTLKRLALGRQCSLHGHRSLRSKTELLKGACALGDGGAIITVVLFLIQTLNKKLVYELISSRPIALNHYVGFLQSEGRITELTDLLTMLGRSPEAAIYQFQHHVKTQGNNLDSLLRKMTNLLANHFNQPGVDTEQCKMVDNYVKLLEWQKQVNKSELFNKSALLCLAHCCKFHWDERDGNLWSPLTIRSRQQIEYIQFDWVVLNVHAISKEWDLVESEFTPKKTFKVLRVQPYSIPVEIVLRRLSELEASKRLLASCIDTLAKGDDRLRLRLAQAYKIHSVVIEIFAKQKDRAALMNYKMTLNTQSEEYILAENTLRNPSIKWKN